MKRIITFRARARFDIKEAADQYEAKSNGLGKRFVLLTSRTIDRIEFMPFIFGKINRRFRIAPIRKFPFGVLYRVT